MEVEVDLALAGARGSAALDVDDVEAVEDRHVHRVAGLVAEPLEVWRGDLAQLHRVDRGEAEVEDPRAEAVLPRAVVLVEVAEARQRGDVAVGRAAASPTSRASSLTPRSAVPTEGGEDGEPALERL